MGLPFYEVPFAAAALIAWTRDASRSLLLLLLLVGIRRTLGSLGEFVMGKEMGEGDHFVREIVRDVHFWFYLLNTFKCLEYNGRKRRPGNRVRFIFFKLQ